MGYIKNTIIIDCTDKCLCFRNTVYDMAPALLCIVLRFKAGAFSDLAFLGRLSCPALIGIYFMKYFCTHEMVRDSWPYLKQVLSFALAV